MQSIFILANRTDKLLINIELVVSFGLIDGDMLFKEEGFALNEEQFGVLEPNTVMPLYLDANLP